MFVPQAEFASPLQQRTGGSRAKLLQAALRCRLNNSYTLLPLVRMKLWKLSRDGLLNHQLVWVSVSESSRRAIRYTVCVPHPNLSLGWCGGASLLFNLHALLSACIGFECILIGLLPAPASPRSFVKFPPRSWCGK